MRSSFFKNISELTLAYTKFEETVQVVQVLVTDRSGRSLNLFIVSTFDFSPPILPPAVRSTDSTSYLVATVAIDES